MRWISTSPLQSHEPWNAFGRLRLFLLHGIPTELPRFLLPGMKIPFLFSALSEIYKTLYAINRDNGSTVTRKLASASFVEILMRVMSEIVQDTVGKSNVVSSKVRYSTVVQCEYPYRGQDDVDGCKM